VRDRDMLVRSPDHLGVIAFRCKMFLAHADDALTDLATRPSRRAHTFRKRALPRKKPAHCTGAPPVPDPSGLRLTAVALRPTGLHGRRHLCCFCDTISQTEHFANHPTTKKLC